MTLIINAVFSVLLSWSPISGMEDLESKKPIKNLSYQTLLSYSSNLLSDKIINTSYALPARRSAGEATFVFSPRELKWGAYDKRGYLIKSGRASGGKSYCADVGRSCLTPRGNFRVLRKGSPHCVSGKFPLGRGGAPMPYCMFFYGGYAIHGSPNVPNYNASHGCIRVRPDAARWLHQEFIRHGTRVIVTSY